MNAIGLFRYNSFITPLERHFDNTTSVFGPSAWNETSLPICMFS